MFEAIFVGLLRLAPVHDGGFRNGGSHRPVDQPVLLEIRDPHAVEVRLETIFPDVLDQLEKETFVNLIAHDVFVRPSGSVGFRESPLLTGHEGMEVIWKWNRGVHLML